MTPEERSRTAARVTRLGVAGAVAGSLAWVQGLAWGAGLGVVAVVAANVVPAWVAPTPAPAPTAPPAPARPRAGTTARAPVEAAPLPAASSATPIASAPPPEVHAPASAEPAEDPPVSESESLAAEAALLERARAALASSPADAIALADTHAVRYPHGALAMERELVAVDALRRQGRAAEARARGEAALARTKGSLYEKRLRKLLDETH